jgi:hypothetical protein
VKPLIDAAELARLLGVQRGFIYDHAAELGAIRLGSGSRPRLRFQSDVAVVKAAGGEAGAPTESGPRPPGLHPGRHK